MKLFIIATVIAISSAARLDHLERGYLPPTSGQGFGAPGSNYNPQPGAPGGSNFGAQAPSYGGQTGFGGQAPASSGSQAPSFGGQSPSFGGQSGFPSSGVNPATSNQYLPPNQGSSFGNAQGSPQFGAQSPSAQYGAPQSNFGGQPNFGGQSSFGQSGSPAFGGQNPSSQYGAPSSNPSSFRPQSQYNPQFPSTSNQYLTPNAPSAPTQNNFENIPQQAFDEQTGYHY